MMLDKRVNFFLCVVLVTCTSPLYKRTLLYDDDQLDQRLSAYLDSTEWPDWLDSVRINHPHQVPSAGVHVDHQAPRAQADEDHLGQSSGSSDIAFLRNIDTTQHGDSPSDDIKRTFAKDFPGHFRSHLKNCAIHQRDKKCFPGINACVCKENDQLIVRVNFPNSETLLDIRQLRTPALALFETFYDALAHYSSTGRPDNLLELNTALNWLWNVLTKHEVHENKYSLPVIGILNSGTKEEDYKWGPLQQSIIKYFTDRDDEPTAAARTLVPCLARSYRSLHGLP